MTAKQKFSILIKQLAKRHSLHLDTEKVFCKGRKWRLDYCFPDLMIAVEYEGIFANKSRHTTISGFTGDVEKYNMATAMGYKLFRATAKDYIKTLDLIEQTILNTKTNEQLQNRTNGEE